MSSKKKYTTVGIAQEVYERLKKEVTLDRRSQSFIIEQALRERYELPWGEQGAENAKQ